jgi:hypothetical protein
MKVVRQFYEWVPTSEIAAELDRPTHVIYRMAKSQSLKKAPELIAETARERTSRPGHGSRRTQFRKGQTSPNKGVRRPGWAPGRMAETQFKKGQRSGVAAAMHQPIGTRRVLDGYLYRKVTDIPGVPMYKNWKLEHHLRWEKFRGPIPAGHALVFRDGNRQNVKLANLELLSRADLALRNSIHNLPGPLKEVIFLKGAINRFITMKGKHAKEQNERSA